MSDQRTQRYAPFWTAVVGIGCAVVLRRGLEPVLHGTQVWLTFWPAVFLTAWFGGWWVGVATLATAVAAVAVWLVPVSNLTAASAVTGGSVFVLCGLAFCYVSQLVRRGYDDERRLRRGYLAFSTALSNASTPEQVATALVEQGAQALGADVAVFAHLVDADSLELIAQYGLNPPRPHGERFPLAVMGPLGAVLRTGREYFVETSGEFRSIFNDQIFHLDPATKATAALPLKVGDRVVGAVALRFMTPRTFSAEERDLLQTLTAQSAQAFERASLLEQERAASQRTRALADLAVVLARSQSVEEVGQAVVSEGNRVSQADTSMLYVLDEARLRLIAERGCAPEVIDQLREIAADTVQGQHLAQEQWIEASEPDLAAIPEAASIAAMHGRAASSWSMPLVVESKRVGVLAMGFYAPRQFSTEERAFVRLFAQHCAQALARAERSARLERERLRLAQIFDANLIGTVFWEAGGRVVRANDSFLRLLGYTRAELAAEAIDLRALTPPEFAEPDRAASAELIANGSHDAYEKEYVHKSGHRVPVLVASAVFFDDRNQGVTYVADLTEVKRAAEAANRAKDQFLALLGHELRNPLAPITFALELLKRRGIPAANRELAVIARQVAQLTRMVDDLLDVSRIRSGKIQLLRQQVEVHHLISRALETIAPLVEQRRHHVTIDVPRAGLLVDVDETRIGQVFGNILTNAAKYTDPGGEIRISVRLEGACVVVEVSDTGVGIEPALLPSVFDPFTQEAQSFARFRGGLGLGLAIARTFVQLHGGEIAAHSDGKGRGTRITVRLPVGAVSSETPTSVAATSRAVSGQSKRRVLVVDDNRDAAEMLAVLVARRGHDTRQANDGPGALEILSDFVPDVALLDLGLPVMDGYELARQIRQAPELSGCRLVAVTGYGQPADRIRSREAGFDVHLVKPLRFQEVIRAIEDDLPDSVTSQPPPSSQ